MEYYNNLRKELMNYPFIKPDPTHMRNLMDFGFEIGDGWLEILKELFDGFMKLELPEDFEIFQVKEKFGELTVYVEGYSEEADDLLLKARQRSIHTCETCGSEFAQKENINGWFKTICEECKEKRK